MQAGVLPAGRLPRNDYALYLGTPDENRKTVVLPVGDEPGVHQTDRDTVMDQAPLEPPSPPEPPAGRSRAEP